MADLPALERMVAQAGEEMAAKFGCDRQENAQLAAFRFGISQGEAVVVAEQSSGDVVGFCAWVGLPLTPPGLVSGLGTYVLPEYRGDHVCHSMRQFAADHCRTLGYKRVRGELALENEAGRVSSEKEGFRVVAQIVEMVL